MQVIKLSVKAFMLTNIQQQQQQKKKQAILKKKLGKQSHLQ